LLYLDNSQISIPFNQQDYSSTSHEDEQLKEDLITADLNEEEMEMSEDEDDGSVI